MLSILRRLLVFFAILLLTVTGGCLFSSDDGEDDNNDTNPTQDDNNSGGDTDSPYSELEFGVNSSGELKVDGDSIFFIPAHSDSMTITAYDEDNSSETAQINVWIATALEGLYLGSGYEPGEGYISILTPDASDSSYTFKTSEDTVFFRVEVQQGTMQPGTFEIRVDTISGGNSGGDLEPGTGSGTESDPYIAEFPELNISTNLTWEESSSYYIKTFIPSNRFVNFDTYYQMGTGPDMYVYNSSGSMMRDANNISSGSRGQYIEITDEGYYTVKITGAASGVTLSITDLDTLIGNSAAELAAELTEASAVIEDTVMNTLVNRGNNRYHSVYYKMSVNSGDSITFACSSSTYNDGSMEVFFYKNPGDSIHLDRYFDLSATDTNTYNIDYTGDIYIRIKGENAYEDTIENYITFAYAVNGELENGGGDPVSGDTASSPSTAYELLYNAEDTSEVLTIPAGDTIYLKSVIEADDYIKIYNTSSTAPSYRLVTPGGDTVTYCRNLGGRFETDSEGEYLFLVYNTGISDIESRFYIEKSGDIQQPGSRFLPDTVSTSDSASGEISGTIPKYRSYYYAIEVSAGDQIELYTTVENLGVEYHEGDNFNNLIDNITFNSDFTTPSGIRRDTLTAEENGYIIVEVMGTVVGDKYFWIEYELLNGSGGGDNLPPEFTVTAADMLDTAEAGKEYRDTVRATDPDGDPVTFSKLTNPDGTSYTLTDSIITWTPGPEHTEEEFGFSIQADDGNGGYDTLDFSVYVKTPETPDTATFLPTDGTVLEMYFEEGKEYYYKFNYEDGDSITVFMHSTNLRLRLDNDTTSAAFVKNSVYEPGDTAFVGMRFSGNGTFYALIQGFYDYSVGTYTIWAEKYGTPSEGFSEDFEGDVSEWNTLDNDGDGNTWEIDATESYSGSNSIRVRWNAAGNDDWLISDEINVQSGDSLVFYAKSHSTSFLEDFNVRLSTASRTDTADFSETLLQVTETPYAWTRYSLDLSSYAGQTVFLAWQCVSVDQYYLYLDDISVE